MPDDKISWQPEAPVAPLPDQRAREILARADRKLTLKHSEVIRGGLSNEMHRLHVEGSAESFVLRIYRRNPAAREKEIALLRRIGDRIPVPEIIDQSTADLPPYLLMRWIEGITLRELKRAQSTALTEAARSIGETLAKISAITFERPGLLGPSLTIEPFLSEATDPIPTFIEQCLSAPETTRRLHRTQRQEISRFIQRRAPELSALNAERSLVHSDFGAANLILNQQNNRWSVAGVIDWEFAFSGSTLADIGNLLRYERHSRPRLEPHFSASFAEHGGKLPKNWRDLSRAVDLTALCEFLTRPDLPTKIIPEIIELISATIEGRNPR